jgi:nitroreductase
MQLARPNYVAWLIDKADFPYEKAIEARLEFIAGYGVLAPSQHNTQPWLISVEGATLTIRPDNTKKLVVGDPLDQGLYIALGACVENILQAATGFGLVAEVIFRPEAIRLMFSEVKAKSADEQVLVAITSRHSDKFPYSEKPVSESNHQTLNGVCEKGVEHVIVTDDFRRNKIVALHAKATADVAADTAFVGELTNWLRPNDTKAYDGMPGFVTGLSRLQARVGGLLLAKKPEMFKLMVKKDVMLMKATPAVVVWAVRDTSASSMFACGRHIERLWLKATELGLALHPMHSICAMEATRKELAILCDIDSSPVFLARLGHHADTGLRTPRKGATWI